MAIVNPVPLYMSNSTLKIAADNYEAAVNSVTITPTTNTTTFKGLTPTAVFKRNDAPDWTAEVQHVQDWETPTSLSNYLLAHAGETVEMVFEPDAGGPSVIVEVVLAPPSIGGAVGAFATSTVSMGVNGQPELVPAA